MKRSFSVIVIALVSCAESEELPSWEERLFLPSPAEALVIEDYASGWDLGIQVDAAPYMSANNIWITTPMCHGVPQSVLDEIGACPLAAVAAACVPNGFSKAYGNVINGSNLFINVFEYNNTTGLMQRLMVQHEIGHCIGFTHTDDATQVMHHTSPSFISNKEKEAAQKVYMGNGSIISALKTGRMGYINTHWKKFRLITP